MHASQNLHITLCAFGCHISPFFFPFSEHLNNKAYLIHIGIQIFIITMLVSRLLMAVMQDSEVAGVSGVTEEVLGLEPYAYSLAVEFLKQDT